MPIFAGTARVWLAQDGTTALIMASGHGHKDCVQVLLESGADKNVKADVRVVDASTSVAHI